MVVGPITPDSVQALVDNTRAAWRGLAERFSAWKAHYEPRAVATLDRHHPEWREGYTEILGMGFNNRSPFPVGQAMVELSARDAWSAYKETQVYQFWDKTGGAVLQSIAGKISDQIAASTISADSMGALVNQHTQAIVSRIDQEIIRRVSPETGKAIMPYAVAITNFKQELEAQIRLASSGTDASHLPRAGAVGVVIEQCREKMHAALAALPAGAAHTSIDFVDSMRDSLHSCMAGPTPTAIAEHNGRAGNAAAQR